MNKLGVHALVWEAGWSHDECARAIARTAETGYDFIEAPALDPSSIDVDFTRRQLEAAGIGINFSMGLDAESDTSSGRRHHPLVSNSLGVSLVQNIDRANTELWLTYRTFDYSDNVASYDENGQAIFGGARSSSDPDLSRRLGPGELVSSGRCDISPRRRSRSRIRRNYLTRRVSALRHLDACSADHRDARAATAFQRRLSAGTARADGVSAANAEGLAPRPAPLPPVKTPLRWSDAGSAVAAEVSRQPRMLLTSDPGRAGESRDGAEHRIRYGSHQNAPYPRPNSLYRPSLNSLEEGSRSASPAALRIRIAASRLQLPQWVAV